MKTAIYPGSFDPFTNGHLDIVERARVLFDRLIVAIAINSSKQPLFLIEERIEMIRQVLGSDENITVTTFDGLLVKFAREKQATAIIRGLRAVTDFDYEQAMFQINRDLVPQVETVFLLAAKEHSFLSSSLIKEIARYGGNIASYAPASIVQTLLKKFSSK